MDRNELAGSGQGLSSYVDVMIVMPGTQSSLRK
jgi:hypothetical protein